MLMGDLLADVDDIHDIVDCDACLSDVGWQNESEWTTIETAKK